MFLSVISGNKGNFKDLYSRQVFLRESSDFWILFRFEISTFSEQIRAGQEALVEGKKGLSVRWCDG